MQDSNVNLGDKVQDRISGFTGIVTTYGNHLVGCDRLGVSPVGEEQVATRGEEEFFYPDQLEVLDDDTEFSEAGEQAVYETEFELGNLVSATSLEFEGIATVINYKLWNCPQVFVKDGVSESEAAWFDAPEVSRVSDGVTSEFEHLYEDETEAEETGSVMSESRGTNHLSR